MELRGKRVLITGASRGIGESLAHAFAEAGATVALVARTQDALRALAAELDGTAHPADLSDPGKVATLVDQVEDEAGPIDVLVNNAGVGTAENFANASNEHLRHITEVNYLAPAELCRQAIPRMLGRGGGHIVNVSSMGGCAAFPGLTAYAASKAALSHFTAGLRADLRGLSIGTTLVELGTVVTDMLVQAEEYEPTAAAFRRGRRLRLMVDVPREQVAVEAVRNGRRHVRIPKRAALFPMLCEAPRRTAEVLLTGVPHRVKQLQGSDDLAMSTRVIRRAVSINRQLGFYDEPKGLPEAVLKYIVTH